LTINSGLRKRSKWIGMMSLLLLILVLLGWAGGTRWIQSIGTAWQMRMLEHRVDPDRLAGTLDGAVAAIPAGEFWMGSTSGPQDEQPQRRIFLDAFEINRFETTNAQYHRYLLASGINPPAYWKGEKYPQGQSSYPVVGVSWAQAQAYCEWIGKRLPSEAEWERACRGDDGAIYPWGNRWQPFRANVGWPSRNNWPLSLENGWELLRHGGHVASIPSLAPVGGFPLGASQYGVFDLVGNASEWTLDWYTWQGYPQTPQANPVGAGPPWNHAVRGSAWFDRAGQEDLIADQSRCAKRNSSHSHDDPRLGFRCARSIQ
jgi:formylglycine-generating enzyme required for sulfatase activity